MRDDDPVPTKKKAPQALLPPLGHPPPKQAHDFSVGSGNAGYGQRSDAHGAVLHVFGCDSLDAHDWPRARACVRGRRVKLRRAWCRALAPTLTCPLAVTRLYGVAGTTPA